LAERRPGIGPELALLEPEGVGLERPAVLLGGGREGHRLQAERVGLVVPLVGPEQVLEKGPNDLVALALEGGANFIEVAIRLGVSHTQARALAEVLELHAISTIYDRAPDLPAGFLGRVRALSGAA